ncbi:hypothetical protein [Herbidospora cretacea]|uniref:hypothetical protein n=1 Tax=Herbidospora cretacea TaxID=28444 RepID=UPI00077366AE|nr:hypothetical protein [Herbidospora cretacea]
MTLSPSWAFSGQAVDGVGDAHLTPGIHYRVLVGPLLGLPVLPLAVSRTSLGQEAKGYTRRDVVWVDSRRRILTPPFTVAPDNPVTAYFPAGHVCCWASVEGRSESGPAGLLVEGVVATPYGDAPVARRGAAPYHVYASHLERVVVSGKGVVSGLAWLPADVVTGTDKFRTAPLPTRSGARYAGPDDGMDQGLGRVKTGAPQRYGMHEYPAATDPFSCPYADPAKEYDRVKALIPEPEKSLDRLVNDLSAPQWLLSATEAVVDENGDTLGGSERPLLIDLYQGAVDPGIARWLGFLDVDDLAPPLGTVMAYLVEGLFAPDWAALAQARLDPGPEVHDGAAAVHAIAQRAPELAQYADRVGQMDTRPFVRLHMILAVTAGHPLDPPGALELAAPVPGGWLPTTAPNAERELVIGLDRLVPAAGLASAMAQPAGGTLAERNPELPPERRLLLTARDGTTSGLLAERGVGEQDGTWQLSQADWFGRWSKAERTDFSGADRPRPPRPVFTLTVRPPALTTPPQAGPLAGTLRVEVSVPPVSGLPAGGRLLQSLKLVVGGVQTVHPITAAETMVVEVPGPALAPTATGVVTVTALWTDSAGADSDPAEPKQATFHDPRPPERVTVVPTLAYTARPDATGRARATLRWTPGPGQAAYRVFVADESTLGGKLADVAAGVVAAGDAGQAPAAAQAATLLAALRAAPDAPARGAVWDANRHLLPRRWWRQLTAEPVLRPASGQAVFTHDVSGSLTVLTLFRIVSVSPASVEADFRTSPLLPRAVPNLLVPPMPSVEVEPLADAARLTLTVPVGPTPAARYRIRRATATTETTLMPVVAEGVLPAVPFTVVDTGLKPWLRYHWRAEVQGPPAPGGGPAGEWSAASPAVAANIMPPGPPAAVTDVTVTAEAAGARVRFRHPGPLTGGATAGYVVDVYRALPGEALRLFTTLPGHPRPADGWFDVPDPGGATGTLYRVVVTDPIGRASQPSDPQEVP